MPLPVGDPEPPIPLNGNGADVIRLEEHSNDSIPPEIMVDATNPAEVGEVGEDGSDLKTDATGYYGYGYSRYRPSLYNYYGNPYYNYRYNGNYYQPQTAQYPQYPQYPQYYYPRNNYYYSSKFCLTMKQCRFEHITNIISISHRLLQPIS